MPLGYVLTRDPLLVKADMLVRRADKAQMTVRRLADALGLSERTLNRRFIELTHEPPQAFIMRRRIEHPAPCWKRRRNRSRRLPTRSVTRTKAVFARRFANSP
jgi:AraC-like DNA-binding protein